MAFWWPVLWVFATCLIPSLSPRLALASPTGPTSTEPQPLLPADQRIVRRHSINNTILIIPSNAAWLAFALNSYCSFLRAGRTDVVILAMDPGTARRLYDRGIPHYTDPNLGGVGTKEVKWLSDGYNRLVCHKVLLLTCCMERVDPHLLHPSRACLAHPAS